MPKGAAVGVCGSQQGWGGTDSGTSAVTPPGMKEGPFLVGSACKRPAPPKNI